MLPLAGLLTMIASVVAVAVAVVVVVAAGVALRTKSVQREHPSKGLVPRRARHGRRGWMLQRLTLMPTGGPKKTARPR
jgi:hypothetical protein